MLFLVLVGVILVLCWFRSRSFLSDKEPPVQPGGIPIIGHSYLLIGDSKHFWNVMKEASSHCIAAGHVITYNIFGGKSYIITNPDDCLTVANASLEKDIVYRSARACFGDGLVTASVNTWKEHRKLLNPKFNVNYVHGFLGVFNKQARNLIKTFESKVDKGPFDHGLDIRRNEMETICLTSLGVDFSKDRDTLKEYANAFDTIFNCLTEQVQRFWLYVAFIWRRSNLKKRRDKHRAIMYNITDMLIQKRKNYHRYNMINIKCNEGENFKPFLDILFDLKKTVGDEVMSDKTMRDHVDTLILAGHDTIAAALQFTLLLMGSYPDVQERLYKELLEVYGDSERDVNKEDLSKLIYLEAVLKESMRIYTIVPVISRYITEDVQLKHYTLKAGNACILMLHGVHRHPIWGNDAEEFKPERWLDQAKLPRNRNAFISFSLGKRVCIGKAYAMISMKTTLSYVLRNFYISADHTKLEMKLECLLKPISGHYISIKRRVCKEC